MLCSVLTRNKRQAYLQYAIHIPGSNVSCVNGFIQGKGPYETSAAILPPDPFGTGKTFGRNVRHDQLITLYFHIKILPDAARGKHQHFVTVVCSVNVYSGSFH